MKNIKVIGYGILMMGMLLVAMPTQAQNFGEQEQPVFQSTSAMKGSGSAYSANPSISADGIAYSPATSVRASQSAQTPSGPRRSPGAIDKPSEEALVPVGDAVLPLMLFAMLFAGVIYLRRRKRA